MNRTALILTALSLLLASGCLGDSDPADHPEIDRESMIPDDIAKRGPDTDRNPSVLHTDIFEDPVPVPYPVNTAGAEDSPFVLPDGNTLYFFFTPDVRVPPEEQVMDDVTGIYVTRRTGNIWSVPDRVWLQKPGRLALDGAVAIQGNEMWFASAREGHTGVNMFTAELIDGEWTNWQYSGDRLMKELQIGEVHIHGNDLYFHSGRPGGKGGYDIWVTTRSDGSWSDPVNIEAVNSDAMDGYPFVSTDGKELWFTRTYMGTPGIFRSLNVDGDWQEPELMVSMFAGEPTLDDRGNLYFVHHYYENDVMIEADIYVAYRK
ncbi:MAG: hypothetical protein QCI82_08450 [Candidatus Thermoplasmatota archaeon]|nr:hypothetical protein [Candidatus Thermoplasmatota archaeon]